MENIATINIYPPRIQDKHGRARGEGETEKSVSRSRVHRRARARAINTADINLMFSFAA